MENRIVALLGLAGVILSTACSSPSATGAGSASNGPAPVNPQPTGTVGSSGKEGQGGNTGQTDPTPSKGEIIRSDYAPGELTRLCKEAMDRASVRLAVIATAPEKSIESLLAFEDATSDLQDQTLPLTFMGYVSTDEKIREEGSQCEEDVNQYVVGIYTRKDIYDAVKAGSPRSPEETRLLSETLKVFETNGLGLDDDKLAQVRALKQELAAKESEFSANLNNDQTSIELSEAELKGVSDSFLKRLKKSADGSRFVVTTKSTDYTQVMENAESGETRRKMLLAYNNRAAEKNVKLMEEAILLRQKISRLMGYATYADYRIHGRMAVDAKTVLDFLNGLKGKLAIRNKADLDRLLAYKKTVEPGATEVKAWDINYLAYQVKKRDYQLDDELVREYFPADQVMKGIFDVYSKLLGVRFNQILDAKPWNSDVKVYEVVDSADGHLLAYFYADYYPRPGKYGHAAAFPLILGRKKADGSYSVPVASIVSNFNPPANGKPSLLNHDEVETIFHEFGHIMHQTLTKAPYGSLAGSAVAQDFVEAPSQMLENWVWDREVLQSLSGHYLDPSKKLPEALLTQMLAVRDFNQGYYYTRQLYLGLMDMTYHTTDGPVDTTAVGDRLYKEIIGINPIEGGHFQAGFGHLMGGYDAGYYGYLWSKVYAEDMFTRFDKEGLLNEKTGRDYRMAILERGSMEQPLDLLRQFLGREPNSDAFLKKLGIGKR